MACGLGGGLLLAASLPPWPGPTGAWPLGLVGAALLFVALDGRRARGRLAVGMAAGIGLYLPGLWWMRDFSLPGYVVAMVMEAAILALGMTLVPAASGWRRAVAFPAALLLVERVRGTWPFGGLPISGIDLGQVNGPLGGAARLGGRLLLVALVGAGGVALAGLARRRWRPALAAAGIVAVLAVAGWVAPDGSPDGRIAVAAVQGGGPRGVRAVETDPGPVFERQFLAATTVRPPVDLVLLPEDVLDVAGDVAGTAEDSRLEELSRALQATLVVGVVEDVPGHRFRNASVAYGPDGTQIDRYDKVHRVPFGEYIPARGFFSSFADLSAIPRDAIVGRGPPTLDTPSGRMVIVISYEVFFDDRVRAGVRAGGRMVLVPTNASSYRDAQVPAQEVVAAQLRALESGRWVVQAAPTGNSAVIDQRGRVRARSGLGGEAVLRSDVGLRSGSTVYTVLGPWPEAWLALLVVGACSSSKVELVRRRFIDG
ncbi:MAG: apolipoprotein N-acyltransferase [Actinomycetota bacterium]|nr:apolipoprotein N-acyltransferase [Actinomycetota bacterium]